MKIVLDKNEDSSKVFDCIHIFISSNIAFDVLLKLFGCKRGSTTTNWIEYLLNSVLKRFLYVLDTFFSSVKPFPQICNNTNREISCFNRSKVIRFNITGPKFIYYRGQGVFYMIQFLCFSFVTNTR